MTCKTWVTRRGSGLLEPFAVPELTLDEAINRGWERHGALLEPKPEEYLPAYPMPDFTSYWRWGQGVPWDDKPVYDFIGTIMDGLRI
jgi:hypothetical protein